MCLNVLELIRLSAEQIYTEDKLQDQHAYRVDISIATPLKCGIRDADKFVLALGSLLYSHVFYFDLELIATERVKLTEATPPATSIWFNWAARRARVDFRTDLK